MSSVEIPAVRLLSVKSLNDVTPASPAFHIPSLDGVRALAFLIVFVSHAGLKDLIPGGFGVTVFFVLSGYLITTLFRMEFDKHHSIDLRAFYIRRSFRILPLLYITLAVAIFLRLIGQTSGQINAWAIISQVLHWSNYYLIGHGSESVVGGTIVLWSLAVEEHFYLLFPLLFRSINRGLRTRTQGWVLAFACAGCLLWRLVLIVGFHAPLVRTELGTDTRFDGLLYGCLMAIVANPILDHSILLTPKRIRWASLLGLAVLLFTFVYRNEVFRYTWRFSLQGIALLPLFAYAIKARGSAVFRLLNARWVAQLGGLSYSLYLIHAIILDWFTSHMQSSKLFIGVLALSIAVIVAKLLQLVVERPLQKLRRRYAPTQTYLA
jgi:peptidoglycan/LPS O-acetylase OafA/YrhL